MKIIIDGAEDLLRLRDGASGAGVLAAVEETLAAAGKAVDVLRFNGAEVSPEDLEARLAATPAAAADVLEIATVSMGVRLGEFLDATCAGVDGLEEQLVDIADQFLRADNRPSLTKLSEWCTDMAGLLDNLDQMQAVLGLDFSPIRCGGRSFGEAVARIREHLSGISAAMERNDRTTVADLLEFEMTPLLSGMKEVLPAVKVAVQARLA